jgi:hypothetical protein
MSGISSVGILTRLRAGQLRNRGSIAGSSNNLFIPSQNVRTGCGVNALSFKHVSDVFPGSRAEEGLLMCY